MNMSQKNTMNLKERRKVFTIELRKKQNLNHFKKSRKEMYQRQRIRENNSSNYIEIPLGNNFLNRINIKRRKQISN